MGFRSASYAFAAMVVLGSATTGFSQSRSPSAPDLPKVYSPQNIPCPERIEVAQNAADRLNSGETPTDVLSLFPPGLSGGTGLCTVTLTEDGALERTYSELTAMGEVPIRFDYVKNGINIFVANRVGDLMSHKPDMTCYGASADYRSVSCHINVDINKGLTITGSTGEQNALSINIDPSVLFKRKLVEAGQLSYELKMLGVEGGMSFHPAEPNCSEDYWKTAVWGMSLSTGAIEGQTVKTTNRFVFEGPNAPTYFGGYAADSDVTQIVDFSLYDQRATPVVNSLLQNTGARIDVDLACGDDLTLEFPTDRLRVLNHIFRALQPKLL